MVVEVLLHGAVVDLDFPAAQLDGKIAETTLPFDRAGTPSVERSGESPLGDLMADGMPYDSDAGRGTAAANTAMMTGRAYLQSAKVAAALGPYEK